MTTSTAALKVQFDMHTRWFANALAGISDAESNDRHNDHLNNMKWVAGHVLNARINSIARLSGMSPDENYKQQFERGVKLDPHASYPAIEEILGKWDDASAQIMAHLGAVPTDKLAVRSPVQVPVPDDTIFGLLSFLLSHEAFHIGQLSILRQLLDKKPMAYS